MHLNQSEVQRFYGIWFPLLHFVNQKRHLVPSFPAQWTTKDSVDPEIAVTLRDALWEDDALLKAFLDENPVQLSADDIALVESWQHRVVGEFFIYKHLAKYTVFLSGGASTRAYGVLGLMESFKNTIGPNVPIYVNAALLPFEGRIIYDGLLAAFPVLFGGGIQGDLKYEYDLLQEREGIITSLTPRTQDVEQLKIEIHTRTQKTLKAFRKDLGRGGLTPKMMEEHTANIASLAETILLSKKSPVGLLDLTFDDIQTYLESPEANPVSLKRFLQFARDSGRLDYDEVEKWLRFLKQRQKK